MSDRFDLTLDHTVKTKPDEGASDDVVTPVRRLEVITGNGRRRQWSDDDKARIVVESLAPGITVSDVARRHGMRPQQLFAWRREARALFSKDADTTAPPIAPRFTPRPADRAAPADVPEFAPVVVAAIAGKPAVSCTLPSRGGSSEAGRIEIVIGDVIVRVIGAVEAPALDAVLRAARSACRTEPKESVRRSS